MLYLICIPWMLIPKPLILWLTSPSHKSEAHQQEHNGGYDEVDGSLRDSLHQVKEMNELKTRASSLKKLGDEEHDISEIAVHQIIETIEFVLGSISNTASYLRLWALSLAHGQLSKVFLEKTIGGGIESANIFVILIGMYMFFNITLGVIMGMDTMECFLHALRLQWVEFNSKFFKADGWKFMPLSMEGPLQASALKVREVE